MKVSCSPVFFRLLRRAALFAVLWSAVFTPVTLLAQGSPPAIFVQRNLDVEIPNLVKTKSSKTSAIADAITKAGSTQAGIARARAVDVDFTVLQNVFHTLTIAIEPMTIRIPFFDDAALLAEITGVVPTSSGGLAFTGSVPGAVHSTVVLVNNDGVVSMNVSTLSKRYSIHGSAQTGYVAKELQQLDLPDHPSPPIVVNAAPLPKPAFQTAGDALLAADSGAQMDVMVVYTPVVRANNGGTAQMHANIDAQVVYTNLIYANSNVVQRLRLVYKGEVAYTETSIGDDLLRLQNPSDGFMDSVPILRDIYQADFVSLWGGTYTTACGLGYTMATESSGFAATAYNVVASPDCTGAGKSTFAHELGHNMGLNHDDFVTMNVPTTNVTPEAGGPAVDIRYAHGYVDTVNRFRTVMAYDDQCRATAPFSSCQRIPNFSNPAILFNGAPTGVTLNAREFQALNDTRETTANFRTGLPDSAFTGPGVVTFLQPIYSVGEAAGSVQLTVSRHVGFTGAISVNYTTASGTATAGAKFTTTSGALTWANADSTPRTITVPIINETLLEGSQTFTVTLSTPVGGVSIGTLNGTTTSATVTIIDDEPDTFPVGGVIPTGFVTPATSSAAWSVDLTSGYMSPNSLRSAAVLGVDGTNFVNSDLEYTATFLAGSVTFYYRVSSFDTSNERLEFMIDGVVPASFTPIGGETGWLFASVPMTAGNHTLRWRFKNRNQLPCARYGSPGGVACADRAWIDTVVFPSAQGTATQTLTFTPASPVVLGASPITLTATASSGLTTFTFSTSSAASVCTVSGNQVTIVGRGLCVITAMQAGDSSFASASLTVNVVIRVGLLPSIIDYLFQ